MADHRPDPSADTPTFFDLGVPSDISDILAAEGFDAPFPIQIATLPDSLGGRDVLGRGRTGSGKTLAFALAVLTRLSTEPKRRTSRSPRALVLAPTRELASQIYRTLDPIGRPLGLRTTTIYGGVSAKPQIDSLRKGVDIVVACPGRLEDLIKQGAASLSGVEVTVLDEADHMADLGFLPVVRRLLDQTPNSSQRLLFSATLDGEIDSLVKRYLNKPVTHSVDSAESPVDTMEHHVLNVTSEDRMAVLIDLLAAPGKSIVFTRTKYKAKSLARSLNKNGIPSVDLHSNLAQNARTRNLAAFSDGRATTLVATDIAARGIHVDDVTLVIHADPPAEHKAYLHRSGRTARAGSSGTVVTMALPEQRSDVASLTRKAKINPTITDVGPTHPLLAELAPGERARLSREDIERLVPGAAPNPPSSGSRSPSKRSAKAHGDGSADKGQARQRVRSKSNGNKPVVAKAGAAKSGSKPGGSKPGGAKSSAKPANRGGSNAAGESRGGAGRPKKASGGSGSQRRGANTSGGRAGGPASQQRRASSHRGSGRPSS